MLIRGERLYRTDEGRMPNRAQIDDALSPFSLRVDESDCATITVHGLPPAAGIHHGDLAAAGAAIARHHVSVELPRGSGPSRPFGARCRRGAMSTLRSTISKMPARRFFSHAVCARNTAATVDSDVTAHRFERMGQPRLGEVPAAVSGGGCGLSWPRKRLDKGAYPDSVRPPQWAIFCEAGEFARNRR